ncbi:hypothetical protein FHX37_3205 [Haloactinospora alba]|uniref:Uncharacterized protein n=1 Tax=Haloactinospora alba TaxID=405555 RepID=A0A543NN00_9ACTN|nr:hypothetical protein [Haloactinospora alba]TQN33202.1 hypothetical protein FHX37_3205 [Haloactinospora alba]
MAFADRRGESLSHAVCRAMDDTLRRTLLLVGLTVTGWLLGGAALAAAEGAAEPDLPEVSTAVDAAGDAAGADTATDTTAEGPGGHDAAPVPADGGENLLSGIDEGTDVSARDALEETGRRAHEAVSRTVGGDGELSAEENSLGDVSLGDSSLVSEPVSDINDGLERTVERSAEPEPRTDGAEGATEAAEEADAQRDREQDSDRDSEQQEPEEAQPTPSAPDAGGAFGTDRGAGADPAPQQQKDAGHDDGSGQPDRQGWHDTSETTGTVSAPGAPAPAGFLRSQQEFPRLNAQRVALPGAVHPAVRDAADDPSFSPD